MTRRPHTVSIADDDRARIPFALIAVLLLVSSIAIVGVLESRETPDVDTDQALAMDRAESVAIAELRQAVIRATEDAAGAPVTSTDGADAPVSAAMDDDEAVFDQYLKLLIYREVSESFASAHQQFDGETTAEASVERIDWSDSDDLEAAIDRVSLEKGESGVLTVAVDGIELTVDETGGQPVTERRELSVTVGTPLYQLKNRTDEFQSQLNTGFFESDGQYDGFGRYFAARMYPYAWGKAYYDRLASGDRAFHNLTPNEHTEVMVNDAVFGLQEKTFGTTDPYKDRAMLLPTLCMAGDLASSAGDIETSDFLPDGEASTLSNRTNLCDSDLIDQEGELPDPPTVQDIVLTMLEDNVETDVEIQAHPFADVAYMQMASGMTIKEVESEFNKKLMESDRFNDDYLNSYFSNQVENGAIADNLGNYDEKVMSGVRGMYDSAEDQNRIKEVIEDIYNVEVYTQENGPFKDDMLPVPSPPEKWAQNPGNWSGPINVTYYASNSPADANVSINIGSSDRNSGFDDVNLAKIDVKYKNSISVKAEWEHKDENRSSHTYWDRKDNITYSSNYDITGDFVSDTIAVERGSRRIQSLFEEDTWDEEYKNVQNFKSVETEAIRETFNLSSTSVESQEQELKRKIESSSHSIITESDFNRVISYSPNPDIDVEPRDKDELYKWVLTELNQTHYEVVTSTEPHQTDLWNMVEKPSPLKKVKKNVSSLEGELVYQNVSEPYDNTADLLRAEVRKQYFENTYDNIERISGWHDDTLGESNAILNGLLGGLLDTSNDLLGGPMKFVDQMTDPETRPEDARASLEGSPLMEDMNYQVEASPTYLSLETVNRTDVPAVRPEGGDVLSIDNINETDHAPLGAGYFDGVGHPGFPLMPWPSLFYLQLDAYYLEVQGEYARFEVRANSGDPTSSSEMTYIREDTDVTIETPTWAKENELTVGSIEPISFDNNLVIPIVVPSPQLMAMGSPGVGDTWRYKSSKSPRQECSTTWNSVGASFESNGKNNCIAKEASGSLPV
jgi:hypothetical protein